LLALLHLVPIPAGAFAMGDLAGEGGGDELPIRRVVVPAFALTETEVTVAQFRIFADATGYRTDAERDAGGREGCAVLDVGEASPVYRAGMSWREPGYTQSEAHPVVCLSYADVAAFVDWLAQATHRPFRLPTEAEWEYAARAGSTTRFPWGDEAAEACRYANGADLTPGDGGKAWPLHVDCSDGHAHAAPVGAYAPNAFGVRDMIGNVWEWTADCYHPDFSGAPADASAWVEPGCAKRTIRGGGWPYPASFLRSANRGGSNAGLRANDRGFRVAL
jgi:formylglycine-generating enzyme required for sulfatase activity